VISGIDLERQVTPDRTSTHPCSTPNSDIGDVYIAPIETLRWYCAPSTFGILHIEGDNSIVEHKFEKKDDSIDLVKFLNSQLYVYAY